MKHLITIALLAASTAHAGTVYRDRPFPVQSGAPCFVLFDGNNVNASHIRDINVDKRQWSKYEGFGAGYVAQPPYLSLRITFITGSYFEINKEDRDFLKAEEAKLLAAIRACK